MNINKYLNDHEALKREQDEYRPVPVVRQVTPAIVQRNYAQIKQEIDDLVNAEMEKIMGDPGQAGTTFRLKSIPL